MTAIEDLLDNVKNYLDITWMTSEEEDEKIKSMILRGQNALRGKIGECDFDGDTQEKTLLFIYVMYERSGALDEFWKNYAGEIVSLQIDRLVNRSENQEPTI